MPIYEYECTRCSSRFDQKQSFNENTPVSCPDCGGDTRRVFSPVPIIFKGSGFYVTDSRDNQGNSSHGSDTDEIKTTSTDETKTASTDEAKTASTDEAKTASTSEIKAGSTEEK